MGVKLEISELAQLDSEILIHAFKRRKVKPGSRESEKNLLETLEVSTDMLEEMSMDDLIKIAKRLPERKTPDGKVITAMDRVAMFLGKAKQIIKTKEQRKKQEVLREMIEEQRKAPTSDPTISISKAK
jgi:hypothetical protein